MRLFHFSEEGDIGVFVPRPVAVPAPRVSGMAWLNGPLVWAIDAWHQPLYLFPRECPRILVWTTPTTSEEDRHAYRPTPPCRMLAYIEWSWCDRLCEARIYRYTLPSDGFQCLHDAGMWVSRSVATPTRVQAIASLPAALDEAGVELRIVPTLYPLRALSRTSLQVSAIRLRNSRGRGMHRDGAEHIR